MHTEDVLDRTIIFRLERREEEEEEEKGKNKLKCNYSQLSAHINANDHDRENVFVLSADQRKREKGLFIIIGLTIVKQSVIEKFDFSRILIMTYQSH